MVQQHLSPFRALRHGVSKGATVVLLPVLALGGLALMPASGAGAAAATTAGSSAATNPFGPTLTALQADFENFEGDLESVSFIAICLAEDVPAILAGERVFPTCNGT